MGVIRSKCAVDFYDVSPPRKWTKGMSTPVRKRKQAEESSVRDFLSAPMQHSVKTRKFEGYLPREPETKKKPRSQSNYQIEQMRLQQYLEFAARRKIWIGEPRVLDYERCKTPDLLRFWRAMRQ